MEEKKNLITQNTGTYIGTLNRRNMETDSSMFIAPSIVHHLMVASGYTSVLKGVPYNKSNLGEAKWLVRKFNKCTLSDIRVRYRGKRLSHPNHTLKSEATHFDVYVRHHV